MSRYNQAGNNLIIMWLANTFCQMRFFWTFNYLILKGWILPSSKLIIAYVVNMHCSSSFFFFSSWESQLLSKTICLSSFFKDFPEEHIFFKKKMNLTISINDYILQKIWYNSNKQKFIRLPINIFLSVSNIIVIVIQKDSEVRWKDDMRFCMLLTYINTSTLLEPCKCTNYNNARISL